MGQGYSPLGARVFTFWGKGIQGYSRVFRGIRQCGTPFLRGKHGTCACPRVTALPLYNTNREKPRFWPSQLRHSRGSSFRILAAPLCLQNLRQNGRAELETKRREDHKERLLLSLQAVVQQATLPVTNCMPCTVSLHMCCLSIMCLLLTCHGAHVHIVCCGSPRNANHLAPTGLSPIL